MIKSTVIRRSRCNICGFIWETDGMSMPLSVCPICKDEGVRVWKK